MLILILICIFVGIRILWSFEFESKYSSAVQIVSKTFYYLTKKLYHQLKHELQRAEKGYSTYDVWDFDVYLCDLIANGIKEIKDSPYAGFPATLTENKYDKILDEIIWTFRTAKEIAKGNISYIPTYYKNYGKITRNYRKIGEKILTKKEARRLEKGFELFTKYFFSFWL